MEFSFNGNKKDCQKVYFCTMRSSVSIQNAVLAGCFVVGSLACFAQSENETRIAFGSCDNQEEPQEMWKEIINQKPQLWIWGGDNIYADLEKRIAKKSMYDKQNANPDYKKLVSLCPITGTWDDHDYGVNDGGKFYPQKNESKELAVDFLGFSKEDPVRKHEGIYNSLVLGKGSQKIKIINLDTRTFRDTVIKVYYIDSLTKKRTYKYDPSLTGDVLGEDQWKWLKEELTNSNSSIFIINSSIQVIPEEHRFEKWSNFPSARQRLFNLIIESKKRILLISGDRHIAEFSKISLPGLSYPLYEFTSSGITHTWTEPWVELNRYRLGDLVIQKNYGLIKIDWSGQEPKVTLQARGLNNSLFAEAVVDFKIGK